MKLWPTFCDIAKPYIFYLRCETLAYFLRHEPGEEALVEEGVCGGSAGVVTAVHEHVGFPAVSMKVTIQNHLQKRPNFNYSYERIIINHIKSMNSKTLKDKDVYIYIYTHLYKALRKFPKNLIVIKKQYNTRNCYKVDVSFSN